MTIYYIIRIKNNAIVIDGSHGTYVRAVNALMVLGMSPDIPLSNSERVLPCSGER